MLICTPVRRDQSWNIGNTGTIVRRNVSVGDRERIFQIAGANDVRIEQNAVYATRDEAVQMVLVSAWDGWSHDVSLIGNLLIANGSATYGHENIRDTSTGRSTLKPGWGGALGVRLEGNRYIGRHSGVDVSGPFGRQAPRPVSLAPPPGFDPARVEGFARFRTRHRRWIIATMRRQFGVTRRDLYARELSGPRPR